MTLRPDWTGAARRRLVLSVALLAVVLVACRGPGDPPELRVDPFKEVSAAVASSELPILVPTELLDGWVLDAITSDTEQGVTVRHWLTFRSPEGLGLPATLCVAASRDVDRCMGEDPQRLVTVGTLAGVWHASERDLPSATRTLNAWVAVPLTPDWQAVSWIHSTP